MTALAPRNVEIIPAPNGNGQLPDLGLASDYVDQLVANGDEEALRELQNQAEAHRLYQERGEHRDQANHFARLKVLAEAGLGALSIAAQPTIPNRDRRRTLPKMIYWWRVMAMAHERGALIPLLDDITARDDSITTSLVGDLVVRYGWTLVPAAAVRRDVERYCKREGSSLKRVACAAGHSQSYMSMQRVHMTWVGAKGIANVIGVDPRDWPPAPPSKRKMERKVRWLRRERKRTGGKWDKAYGYFRQCLSEFQELAPNQDPRWDEAYAHLYAIEQLIGRQLSKERTTR